jgi:hypothetical protein
MLQALALLQCTWQQHSCLHAEKNTYSTKSTETNKKFQVYTIGYHKMPFSFRRMLFLCILGRQLKPLKMVPVPFSISNSVASYQQPEFHLKTAAIRICLCSTSIACSVPKSIVYILIYNVAGIPAKSECNALLAKEQLSTSLTCTTFVFN